MEQHIINILLAVSMLVSNIIYAIDYERRRKRKIKWIDKELERLEKSKKEHEKNIELVNNYNPTKINAKK